MRSKKCLKNSDDEENLFDWWSDHDPNAANRPTKEPSSKNLDSEEELFGNRDDDDAAEEQDKSTSSMSSDEVDEIVDDDDDAAEEQGKSTSSMSSEEVDELFDDDNCDEVENDVKTNDCAQPFTNHQRWRFKNKKGQKMCATLMGLQFSSFKRSQSGTVFSQMAFWQTSGRPSRNNQWRKERGCKELVVAGWL
jgi:hypothetical protein